MYILNLTVPIHALPPLRLGLTHLPQGAFPNTGLAAAMSAGAQAFSCWLVTDSISFPAW